MSPYVYPDLGSPPYISTIGTVVLGGVMGLMLYGLTLHQTYRYYRLGPPDSISMKVFVFVIFCLETFHAVLWLMTGYHYLVVDPFITGSLAHGHWFVRLIVPVTALTVALTQCFYLRRIYLIGSMYRRLAAPAGLGLAISQGFAIAAGIYAFKLTPAIVDFQHISWLFSVAYGFVGITDILLAATLVYVLRRSRTGTRRADSMLDTLIIYTINTGVLTSLCSILAFVFALILPGNLVYAGLSIIGTKLYASSVLAVLNSRREINNRFLDDFTLPEMPQFLSMASRATSGLHGAPSSSLPWNGPQNSACLSNRASIEQTEGAPSAESDESGPEIDIHDFSKVGLRNSMNSAV